MEVVSVRPVLFEADNTNFDHNGIGVLYDAASCIVTEEYNGAFDLELEYPVDGDWINEITEGRIILAKPNDMDDPHAFRIYEIDKDLISGIIIAKATSITDDLAANLITSITVTNVTAQDALTAIKNSLIEPTIYDFVSDIQTQASGTWTRINPLQAIAGTGGSLISLWGGDIKRTNNTVYLYSRRGKDNVTVIRPGKNINGFNMTISNKGVVTKILPYYSYQPETIPTYSMVDDGSGNIVKQQDYNTSGVVTNTDSITVTGNPVVSSNASNYAVNYYSPIDFSQNDSIKNNVDTFIQNRKDEAESSPTIIDNSNFPSELHDYVLSLLNQTASDYFINNPGCDTPSVQVKADLIQLSDSSDWEKYKSLEQIQVTDTVDVYVQKFNVDISLSIQSIQYDSIGERVIAITAGSAKNNLVDSIVKSYDSKVSQLQTYVSDMENGVYNTISRTADGQSKKFTGYTEPPADTSTKGDLWFKEVGDGSVESYMYNGAAWIPVVSDSNIQAMDQAISDAQSTANAASDTANATANEVNSVVTENGYTTLSDLIASKVSNGDYSTLFAQNAKTIGLFYDVNGVTEAMILLDNGTPYIKGNNIVLDGDTIVDGTFTVTDTMLAADAVIKKLTASGIDAKDVTIINLDASSITGGDLTVTSDFRIMHNGTPVLEVDAATGQVKITAPNLATQDDLKNIELTPGPAGEDATSVEIISSNGNIFKSGTINTVLDARVYKGGVDITDTIDITKFRWTRVSDDSDGDKIWNDHYFGGTKTIVVTTDDVYRKATFFCEILD